MSTLSDRLKKIEKMRVGKNRKHRFVIANNKNEEDEFKDEDNEILVVLRLYD